ncbi:hypothetical protein GOV14_01965 [Candidatus Pacearchaeota archaeon]|nr:hypothetical protein [Candidatus Pacearchaeota archaeon]
MDDPNLYLVGTVHTDLDGEDRLDTLLNKISPSIIALEFHKEREFTRSTGKSPEQEEEEKKEFDLIFNGFGLEFNPRQRETFIEAGNLTSGVMGYEFISSKNYVENNPGTRLEYVDLSIYQNGKKEFQQGYVEALKASFKEMAKRPELIDPFLESLDKGIEVHKNNMKEQTFVEYEEVDIMAELYDMMQDPKAVEEMKQSMPPEAVQSVMQMCNPERDEVMGQRIRRLYDGFNGDGKNEKLIAIVGVGHLEGLRRKFRDLNPRILTLDEYESV